MYKSLFLKNKIQQQNDKRKIDKKQPRPKAQTDDKKGTDPKSKGAARKRGENEEELLEIIEELKNELRQRDQEFEQIRDRNEKLEKANTFLAKGLLDIKKDKITIESKLNKLRTLKEIDENFSKISSGSFFLDKKTNAMSLRTNLLDSVNDQYKSSLVNSYVAKYAHIWLDKVRQRRRERESNALF